MKRVEKNAQKLGEVSRIDGVKITTEKGWLLIRPSGTEPVMRIMAEARDEKSLDELIGQGKKLVSGRS